MKNLKKTSISSNIDFNLVLFIFFFGFLFSVSSCNTDFNSKEEKKNQNSTVSSNLETNSDTNSEENSHSDNGNSTFDTPQQPNSIRPIYSEDSNSDKQNLYAELSARDSSEFFKRFVPKTQIFKISNNEEQDI